MDMRFGVLNGMPNCCIWWTKRDPLGINWFYFRAVFFWRNFFTYLMRRYLFCVYFSMPSLATICYVSKKSLKSLQLNWVDMPSQNISRNFKYLKIENVRARMAGPPRPKQILVADDGVSKIYIFNHFHSVRLFVGVQIINLLRCHCCCSVSTMHRRVDSFVAN